MEGRGVDGDGRELGGVWRKMGTQLGVIDSGALAEVSDGRFSGHWNRGRLCGILD